MTLDVKLNSMLSTSLKLCYRKGVLNIVNSKVTILFAILFCVVSLSKAVAQKPISKNLISPIYGSLVLVGDGHMSAYVKATFANLADDNNGTLVVIASGKEKNSKMQWQEYIGVVEVIHLKKSSYLTSSDIQSLKTATAIWLTDDFSKHFAKSQIYKEMKLLLLRDGVIGGCGIAAESMGTIVSDGNGIRNGFDLLPNSLVYAVKGSNENFDSALENNPGRVGWEIPPSSSVVIHDGREISVISYPEITLRIAAVGDWPERVATFAPPIDDLPYTSDLISWNRSAVARKGEVFPPTVAPIPEVPNGALIIIGGHGYPDGMWERVIEFAGGENANYVCFAQSASSTGAKKLRELGCKNVAVHIVKTGVDGIGQSDDIQLLEDLKKADAVYFGGGRSYKFMDAYLDTEAHILMNKVLERGGIILGGSAGAQIQGDFLVRGDPRTNSTLWMEGNDVGLGFLKGVIIDVHFRERGRENKLPSLLVKHPQMLGIGIDETTAIFVQGTTAEVMGPHSVTFYDLKDSKNIDPSSAKVGNPVVLMGGEKYDLQNRIPID